MVLRKKQNFLIWLSTLGMLVYYHIPFFNSFPTFARIGITCSFIVFFYCGVLTENVGLFFKNVLASLFVALFILLQYYSQWIDTGVPFFQRTYFSFLFWFPFIQAIHLTRKNDLKLSKIIVFLAIITCTFTAITTIVGLAKFPMASRELATGSAIDIYSKNNIGGYGFIYTLVMFIPLFLYAIKYSNSFFVKISYLLSLLIFYLCIIKSQYTMAAILSVLVLPLFFVKKINFNYYFFTLFLIGSALFFSIRKIGFYLLAKTFYLGEINLNFLNFRINQIIEGLVVAKNFVEVGGRAQLYHNSIECFLENPVVGIWLNPHSIHSIGWHSSILDLLGSSGMIGGLFLLVIVIVYLKKTRAILHNYQLWNYFKILFLMILTLSIFNTVFTSSSISMLFFVVAYNFYHIEEGKSQAVCT